MFVVALLAFSTYMDHAGAAHTHSRAQSSLQGNPPLFDSVEKEAMLAMLRQLTPEKVEIKCGATYDEVYKGGSSDTVINGTGIDFRGCYGPTVDLLGFDVCGNKALEVFTGKLGEKTSFKKNETGASGSSIIVDIPGFIIKSAKDDEYHKMQDFLSKYGDVMGTREYTGCHRTALAPICAALTLNKTITTTYFANSRFEYKSVSTETVHWVIMRTVEIPAEKKHAFKFRGKEIDEYDLKGPRFAARGDGKTYLYGTDLVKGKKDFGFTATFPNGIKLDGCGSRDAAIVLGQDSKFLRQSGFTDYSLLAVSYVAGRERNDPPPGCDCRTDEKPVFPLILEGDGGNVGPVRFAVAIIDYLETGYKDDVQIALGSTMLRPDRYRHAWMKMFPTYFSLPLINSADFGALKSKAAEAAETAQLADSADTFAVEKVCAIERIVAIIVGTTNTGSKCKFDAGTELKIVKWETVKGKTKVEVGGAECFMDPDSRKSLAAGDTCPDESKAKTEATTLRFMRTVMRRVANRATRRFVN